MCRKLDDNTPTFDLQTNITMSHRVQQLHAEIEPTNNVSYNIYIYILNVYVII